jgi:hypothetical protein
LPFGTSVQGARPCHATTGFARLGRRTALPNNRF